MNICDWKINSHRLSRICIMHCLYQGCNFNCPFVIILLNTFAKGSITEDEVLAYLEKRKSFRWGSNNWW